MLKYSFWTKDIILAAKTKANKLIKKFITVFFQFEKNQYGLWFSFHLSSASATGGRGWSVRGVL